ncbi:hypothetical protein [Kitasatospora griseola]|uniref:hypothetical protein n=1 Tax=Kitasatospora griseola TaxID=2064 RepID=UPI003420C971
MTTTTTSSLPHDRRGRPFVPPGQAVPLWGDSPTGYRPLSSQIDLVLAAGLDASPPRADTRTVAAAAALDRSTHGHLGPAARHAAELEAAALRSTAAAHDQVLHIGYGLSTPDRALYDLWSDLHQDRRGLQMVATTTCRYAHHFARSACSRPGPVLLYEFPSTLARLPDNPYLTEYVDFGRPVGVVLAGLHRTPSSPADALLARLLARLAPGSTITLGGVATDTNARRLRLQRAWKERADRLPLIAHLPRLAARTEQFRPGGLEPVDTATAPAADLPVHAYTVTYRITDRPAHDTEVTP